MEKLAPSKTSKESEQSYHHTISAGGCFTYFGNALQSQRQSQSQEIEEMEGVIEQPLDNGVTVNYHVASSQKDVKLVKGPKSLKKTVRKSNTIQPQTKEAKSNQEVIVTLASLFKLGFKNFPKFVLQCFRNFLQQCHKLYMATFISR